MTKIIHYTISYKFLLMFVGVSTFVSKSHSAKEQVAVARPRYYSTNNFYPSYRKFVRNAQGEGQGQQSETPVAITAPIQSPNKEVSEQENEPKLLAGATQTRTTPQGQRQPPEPQPQQPSQIPQSPQPQTKSESTQPSQPQSKSEPKPAPQSNLEPSQLPPPPQLQPKSQQKTAPQGDFQFRDDQEPEQDFIELTPWPPALQLPLPKPLLLATTESMQIQKTQSPAPVQSNCFMVFPGTPTWNDCFKKFNEEMAANKKSTPIKAIESQIRAPNPQIASTSNSVIAGYLIRAENIPLTTVVTNGVVKIMFSFGDDGDNEKLDLKRDGRLITIKGPEGYGENAEVRIPEEVDPKDVKDSRTAYALVITGPVLKNNKNGDVHISQSKSGFGWSSSGPQMHGVYQNGEFPPVLVPLKAFDDFSRKLKGILEGIQKQAFDGPEQNQPNKSPQQQSNDGPMVWHPWLY